MCEYFRQAFASKEARTISTDIRALPKKRLCQETLTGRTIMQIKTIVTAAAIALAATIGSASAADQFSAIEGIPAEFMSAGDMDAVVGGAVYLITDTNPGFSDADALALGLGDITAAAVVGLDMAVDVSIAVSAGR
jgi:hypothetical protein